MFPVDASETQFSPAYVRQIARDIASKPYVPPDTTLRKSFRGLDYDRYRTIRFLPERALWREENLPFEVQFFHREFLYLNKVDIFEIAGNRIAKIAYQPDAFSFGKAVPPPAHIDLGFAGFRIHAPINKPDYYDEVCVFLGASYFRAVAKGEIYGLSARGLAINTGEAKARNFRYSRHSGSRSLPPTQIPSWCMRCSTAKAPRPPIASRSGPATPPSSMWKWRSIRGSISTMPV